MQNAGQLPQAFKTDFSSSKDLMSKIKWILQAVKGDDLPFTELADPHFQQIGPNVDHSSNFSALLFVHLYTTYLFFKRMKLQFDVEMHGILCSIVVRIGSSVLHGKFENLIDVLYFIIANLCLLSNIGFPVSLQDGILLNFF